MLTFNSVSVCVKKSRRRRRESETEVGGGWGWKARKRLYQYWHTALLIIDRYLQYTHIHTCIHTHSLMHTPAKGLFSQFVQNSKMLLMQKWMRKYMEAYEGRVRVRGRRKRNALQQRATKSEQRDDAVPPSKKIHLIDRSSLVVVVTVEVSHPLYWWLSRTIAIDLHVCV